MERKKDYHKSKTGPRWLRWVWGVLPWLFLGSLVFVFIMLSGKVAEKKRLKESVSLNKQTRQAASLLKTYGVKPEDLEALIAEKIGEAEFKRLSSSADEADRAVKAAAVINVVALEVLPAPIRDRINLPGNVEPWVKLEILAEVAGKIEKKSVREGDRVKKGDILVKLDTRDYLNAYNSAKASYENALASRERLRKLHTGKLSTRSQLDEAIAHTENFKAVMDTAELNLERCKIRAPISGTVNRMFVEKGTYLNVADPVAEVLRTDRVKIRVGIPESDVDPVRRVSEFDVRIDALGGKIFKAKKYFLSRTADSFARLYGLDLELPNPKGEILPDMFVRVEIVKTEVPEGLSVPLYSVITRNDENIVYVLADGKAQSRKVRLGLQEGWRIQAESGLESGDLVAVIGHRGLSDGQPVNIVKTVRSVGEIAR